MNVVCGLKKNMYSAVVEFSILYIIIRSILLTVLFKYSGYLLIFLVYSINYGKACVSISHYDYGLVCFCL